MAFRYPMTTMRTKPAKLLNGGGTVAIGFSAGRGALPTYDYQTTMPGSRASVAIGMNAMAGKVAETSVAIGSHALYNSSTAYQNVAVGNESMRNTTTGYNNTAVGFLAGRNITSGINNTLIGNYAGNDTVGNITTQSNYVVIGNNSTTNANIKVSWTVTSDARDKTDIVPVPHGLNFVKLLQPKQFKLMDRETQQATTSDRYGFVAQDVLAVEGENPVLIDNSDEDNLKMKESLLIPILTKAIQELSDKLDDALAKIAVLEAK